MTAQTHAYKMKIFMHKRMSLPLLSRLSSLVPSPPPSLSPSPSPSRCPPFISTSSKEGDGERGEGERGRERARARAREMHGDARAMRRVLSTQCSESQCGESNQARVSGGSSCGSLKAATCLVVCEGVGDGEGVGEGEGEGRGEGEGSEAPAKATRAYGRKTFLSLLLVRLCDMTWDVYHKCELWRP